MLANRRTIIVALLGALLFAIPAYAHESRTYQIGDTTYSITVGSLGEPVVVDDKSGIDLTISRNGEPFVGAEEVLKVEIGIGDAKKTLDLAAAYGAPGKYKTTTFYTKTDTLSYRLFGTLENTSIDFFFECAAAGHQMHGVEDTTRVEIAPGITQTLKRGGFGCVAEKSEYQFPVGTGDQSTLADSTNQNSNFALAALAIAVIAFALALRSRGGVVGYTMPSMAQTQGRYGIAIGLLAGVAIGYGVFAYLGSMEKKAPAASHGAHAMIEVDQKLPIPSVVLHATKDSKDGYNLHLATQNFIFTPESVGGVAKPNTGHAHLYVNGIKVARLYSPWFNLGAAHLQDGENKVEVTLNADDHSEWAVDGKHIGAETVLVK